jgi:hypothetical protein
MRALPFPPIKIIIFIDSKSTNYTRSDRFAGDEQVVSSQVDHETQKTGLSF